MRDRELRWQRRTGTLVYASRNLGLIQGMFVVPPVSIGTFVSNQYIEAEFDGDGTAEQVRSIEKAGFTLEQPPSPSDHPYPDLPKAVVYVGETKHLDERPLRGLHYRAEHYQQTFTDDLELRKLFLSVARVHAFQGGYGRSKASDDRRLRVFTQYVGARIYWAYTKKWQQLPELHYKRPRRQSGDEA